MPTIIKQTNTHVLYWVFCLVGSGCITFEGHRPKHFVLFLFPFLTLGTVLFGSASLYIPCITDHKSDKSDWVVLPLRANRPKNFVLFCFLTLRTVLFGSDRLYMSCQKKSDWVYCLERPIGQSTLICFALFCFWTLRTVLFGCDSLYMSCITMFFFF